MKRHWLKSISWPVVVETNRLLCEPKNAFHGPTRDGYPSTMKLWNSQHQLEMTITEAIHLCRECHRLAPFCNFNGNTFVAIIRQIITRIDLPPDISAALRSLAGHVVAGIATPEEEEQLLVLIAKQLNSNNE